MPCCRIRSAVRCERYGDWPLISVWMWTRPLYRPSTSSNVGIRSPAKCPPNQEPASSFRSVASVKFVTGPEPSVVLRSEEHTSELQSLRHLVCRLLLEKNK